MRDGSDAVADWALLNGLLSCASGATWVSIHRGGGVGIGYSQHAEFAIVCDGTERTSNRLAFYATIRHLPSSAMPMLGMKMRLRPRENPG